MNALLQSNAVLGLLAAIFWGGGDFCGGMASKHSGGTVPAALRVVLLSHTISMTAVCLIAWALGDPIPSTTAILWGMVAGVANGLALAIFYVSLSSGAMGAAAAISGLLAAALPAIISAFTEGSSGWRRYLGFAIAALAIWLIAGTEGEHELAEAAHAHAKRTTWLALASGLGFGIFFTAIKYAGEGSTGVLLPMATTRIGSLATCAITLAILSAASRRGEPASEHALTRRSVYWILGGCVVDTSGNLFYIAATQHGRLDVAAVLGSLYPASTIILASRILKERTTVRQNLGFAIAVAAAVLITL
ncbi:EamA family transporter [Terriglobus tenax]|uniref:EamA family transporter n=1 Tax=Terriglobus tenax TaxID=1111115 RepID=UPI0021E010C1|nr:EamA family transporter [Terriglobus tenax]